MDLGLPVNLNDGHPFIGGVVVGGIRILAVLYFSEVDSLDADLVVVAVVGRKPEGHGKAGGKEGDGE